MWINLESVNVEVINTRQKKRALTITTEVDNDQKPETVIYSLLYLNLQSVILNQENKFCYISCLICTVTKIHLDKNQTLIKSPFIQLIHTPPSFIHHHIKLNF